MGAYPFADIRFFTHASLPVAAAYCRTLDVMGVVNRIVPTSMGLSAGMDVHAMVLDVLSCKSPMYRIEQFLEHQDRLLLLGKDVDSHILSILKVGYSSSLITALEFLSYLR